MIDTLVRRGFIFSVVILFIGVAVVPTINFQVVKASDDNDLVEVTTQACGIKGFGNTTVKLTREQYQNLEQYLVEFRARLNQTSTREEAVPIFKDAVVELDKYGLLPRGMSVEKAQRLVVHDLMKNSFNVQFAKPGMNLLCFVAGRLNWAEFIPLLIVPLALVAIAIVGAGVLGCFYLASRLHNDSYLWLAIYILSELDYFLSSIILMAQIMPVTLFSYTGPLWCGRDPVGWLTSVGLLGFKSWNGSFSSLTTIFGFTGLKLFTLYDEETFLIGTALYLKIVPD